MYYPESATYYLHDPSAWAGRMGGPIEIGTAFQKGAIVTVKPNGFRQALDDLATLSLANGRRPHLEIHCHGLPAQLLLGALNAVDARSVRSFGYAISRLIMPGGLVEILACRVAAQWTDDAELAKLLEAEPRLIQGYRREYHDAIRKRKSRPELPLRGRALVMTPTSGKPKPIADRPGAFFAPDPDHDGLHFCLELAQSSRCVVRAAVTVQYEEDDESPSPIGNWENEVFDFYPHGEIKFQGASPYRGPIMNSFDLDRLTA